MQRDPKPLKNGTPANSYIQTPKKGLQPHYESNMIFRQDNAKIHIAEKIQEWFETHGIHVLGCTTLPRI